jgi:hypothetical protein
LETALGISPSRKDHQDSRGYGNETTTAEVVVVQFQSATTVYVEKAHERISSEKVKSLEGYNEDNAMMSASLLFQLVSFQFFSVSAFSPELFAGSSDFAGGLSCRAVVRPLPDEGGSEFQRFSDSAFPISACQFSAFQRFKDRAGSQGQSGKC